MWERSNFNCKRREPRGVGEEIIAAQSGTRVGRGFNWNKKKSRFIVASNWRNESWNTRRLEEEDCGRFSHKQKASWSKLKTSLFRILYEVKLKWILNDRIERVMNDGDLYKKKNEWWFIYSNPNFSFLLLRLSSRFQLRGKFESKGKTFLSLIDCSWTINDERFMKSPVSLDAAGWCLN